MDPSKVSIQIFSFLIMIGFTVHKYTAALTDINDFIVFNFKN